MSIKLNTLNEKQWIRPARRSKNTTPKNSSELKQVQRFDQTAKSKIER